MYVAFCRYNKKHDSNEHGDEGNEVADGEADFLLHINHQRKGDEATHVNEPVEPEKCSEISKSIANFVQYPR